MKNILKVKFDYLKLVLWATIMLMVIVRLSSISRSAENFLSTLEPIIKHPFASYDEKMSMKYPRYYNLIGSIKRQTDEHSTIYIPEVNIKYGEPLWALGTMRINQALLYPRKVLKYSGKERSGYLVFFTDTDQGVIALK